MKLAVAFPGIGYHVDKPLLYYGKKVAAAHGYDLMDVPYGNFPSGVKGDAKKMEECFYLALEQAEELLKNVDFSAYEEILFLSKSVGTAIASAYGKKHHLTTKNVYFTPVAQSFPLMEQPGIVFHGTKDGWVKTEIVKAECEKRNLPLFIIADANHSLETGEWERDLENLLDVMREVNRYLGKETAE
ncbi:MAG: alpha/beta hydrolase [Lachnospiraceae bacterium]|nr:alpha/beta hydrolase [Lachnospiraceae bacterium]